MATTMMTDDKDKMVTDGVTQSAPVPRKLKRRLSISESIASAKDAIPYNFVVPDYDAAVIERVFTKAQPLTKEQLEELGTLRLDMWKHSNERLLYFLYEMFKNLGLLKTFNIPLPTFYLFLLTIELSYRKNAFHNFRHAFTVTQMTYVFLQKGKMKDILTDDETLALMIACLCHDLDHPGLSNGYHVNAKTSLALLYNDASPLENHHSTCTWSILFSQDTNILSNLSPQQFKAIRELVIQCILSTDMSLHFTVLADFEKKLNSGQFSWSNKQDRVGALSVLIKCADISNETRPWDVSKPWADALLEEFFTQGDTEKAQGLPVTPFMDRLKVTQPKTQIGFIDAILLPSFFALSRLFPDLGFCLEGLQANRQKWSQLTESHTDGPKS